MSATILPNGRIEGTRTTVYHVMDYALLEFSADYVSKYLPITVEQAQAALDYISAHRAEVDADYKVMVERCERGNPPEVIERLNRARDRMIKYREELRARAAHRV